MNVMLRQYRVPVAAVVVVATMLAVSMWFLPRFEAFFAAKNNTVQELRHLPVGATAELQGVVTYADSAGKRFWIQDDTGAVAIEEDPHRFGLRPGHSVHLAGTKTRPYDPLLGPTSVELRSVRITPSKTDLQMPAPANASLRALPDRHKTGLRIQLTGVVRQVIRDDLGRVQLAFGEAGQEAPVTLAEANADNSHWVDAKVRIVGIGESISNESGTPSRKHIWVQSSNDVRVVESAPPSAPVYSIRNLYRDAEARNGHRIRIYGRVAATLSPTSVLVEDRWGAVACELDSPQQIAVGTTIAVTGFPTKDGVRIDLLHASLTKISAKQIINAEEEANLPELTTVASIRALSTDRANAALPVRITGVVTANDADWRQMFVQDSTGGIYLKYSGSRVPLIQGERVLLTGITNAGDYAPVIVAPKLLVLGQGKLPRPVSVTANDAASGVLDSQFVEVQGVVHPMKLEEETRHPTFELYASFGQVHVYADPAFANARYLRNLVDATVRIRGVLGTVFNSRRQLVGYQLWISSSDDIEVLQPPTSDPFDADATPVANLLRFSPHADLRHRHKVKGSVTMVGNGYFYMQDDSGGLQVRSDTASLRVGDRVEAAGYTTPGGGYSPVFIDAMVHVLEHGAPIVARQVTAESGNEGQFDSQLVTTDGRLLSVLNSPEGKSLILQSSAVTFDAQLDGPDSEELRQRLKEGSVLRLTGVCSAQVDPNRLYLLLGQEPLDIRLLLRSPQDIEVLRPASWWTTQHSLAVLGIMVSGVLVAFGWGTMLQRRVRRQNDALLRATEKAEAVASLAAAMQNVTLVNDFTARVAISGNDEIAQLGAGFNKMLTELEQRDLAKLEAEAKLQNLALTDELTGLPNRRLLSDRLTHTLALARRERRIVAVLYLDLDGFKLVNDSLGHTIGDILLGEVAQRLQSRIRQADTLARIGGDEFTVVLAGLHTKDQAELVAHTLLDALAKPFLIENHEITVGASIGISLFPETANDGVDLLQQADSAMYAAKRNGKNQVMYFTPELGSSVRERSSLENQLRGAVLRNEMSLHYQPEFDVLTHRLIRFEALARWTHPTLGTIPPSKFIPIAEESGLIVPIGAYLMEHACREAAKWQNLGPYPVGVAVNVSSLQFGRPTFVEEVAEILASTGLNPELLQIELTESVMLRGAERVSQTMKQLRALGVSLAIDDFGTGYSCLSYLPRLPFNALKIDRSFVNELESRSEIRAMVHSLVTLAHNLGMQVIVEGIETPRQLELIKKVGGNEVQGYLLGRPTANPASQIATAPASTEIFDSHELVELSGNS